MCRTRVSTDSTAKIVGISLRKSFTVWKVTLFQFSAKPVFFRFTQSVIQLKEYYFLVVLVNVCDAPMMELWLYNLPNHF